MQQWGIWVCAATLSVAAMGRGNGTWVATAQAFKVRETREECSAFGSVISRLKRDLKERTELLGEVQEMVVVKKNALETCAKQNGLVSYKTQQEEVTLADVCHEQYDSWLTPALHVEMVNEEVESLNHDLGLLLSHVQERCSRMQRNGS